MQVYGSARLVFRWTFGIRAGDLLPVPYEKHVIIRLNIGEQEVYDKLLNVARENPPRGP